MINDDKKNKLNCVLHAEINSKLQAIFLSEKQSSQGQGQGQRPPKSNRLNKKSWLRYCTALTTNTEDTAVCTTITSISSAR